MFVLSQSGVCTQDAPRAIVLRLLVNAVQSRYGDQEFLRLARECKRVHTAADNTEKTIEMGIFVHWKLHYFTKIMDL